MPVVPYPQGQNVGELRNMANVEVLQYRKPNGEIVKNIFFWVLPVLIFLLSGMTRPGMVFNSANFTFLLIKGLCGLTISVAIAVIRSKRDAGAKLAGVFGCIVLFMIFSFMRVLSPRMMHTCTTENAREKFLAKVSLLYPVPFSLPDDTCSASPAEYHVFTYDIFLGESNACTLMCHYDEAEYKAAVADLERTYAFFSDQKAFIGNDRFRLIRNGNEDEYDWFDKSLMIVMTNDKDHDIAFILLYNPLQKTLSLSEAIDRYCGLKYLRR